MRSQNILSKTEEQNSHFLSLSIEVIVPARFINTTCCCWHLGLFRR